MAQFTTLSSAGTAAIILNPVAKSTTVLMTNPASGTASVEVTLDDPTIVGGPSLTWALLSSAAQMISSNATGSVLYTVLGPIGGVRINASSNAGGGTFTLKALQSVIA